MSREAIYAALFELGSAVTWSSQSGPTQFKTASRRVLHWTDCPDQPALFQQEMDEEIAQKTGLPYRLTLSARWIVYQNRGKNDPKAVPTTENNLILDALQGALVPEFAPGVQFTDRCTLGGLVHHAFIGGRVRRDAGDLDGQGVMLIPITVLVP